MTTRFEARVRRQLHVNDDVGISSDSRELPRRGAVFPAQQGNIAPSPSPRHGPSSLFLLHQRSPNCTPDANRLPAPISRALSAVGPASAGCSACLLTLLTPPPATAAHAIRQWRPPAETASNIRSARRWNLPMANGSSPAHTWAHMALNLRLGLSTFPICVLCATVPVCPATRVSVVRRSCQSVCLSAWLSRNLPFIPLPWPRTVPHMSPRP